MSKSKVRVEAPIKPILRPSTPTIPPSSDS